VVPLTLTLNGDVAIFTITTAVEFGPEVSYSHACHWYMQRGWRACTAGGTRATDGV
jgi:hypothetical protein